MSFLPTLHNYVQLCKNYLKIFIIPVPIMVFTFIVSGILSVLFSAMLTFDLNILYLNFFMIMTVFVMFGSILVIKSQPTRLHFILAPFQVIRKKVKSYPILKRKYGFFGIVLKFNALKIFLWGLTEYFFREKLFHCCIALLKPI